MKRYAKSMDIKKTIQIAVNAINELLETIQDTKEVLSTLVPKDSF